MKRVLLLAAGAVGVAIAIACGPRAAIPPEPGPKLELRAETPQDTAPKAEPRMVPPEAYMRTYLTLFGGLAPVEVQKKARGADGAQLFDAWDDYFAALGFPDYRIDMPRATQTNALMVATFERLGVALCDRAVEHDLKANALLVERTVFAFETPKVVDRAAFDPRFDVLHRTFLGYPAKLAPPERGERFFALFQDVMKRHEKPGTPKSRFTPSEAGWASVCYGLIRHPEFQLY
jgi:hypothetical protein